MLSSGKRAGRRADQTLKIGFGDAAQIRGLDGQNALMRQLRLGGRHVVGRNQPGRQPAAHVAHVRVGGVERTPQHVLRLARRQDGVERARDLEAQIRARSVEILPRGRALRRGRVHQRVRAAAGVDRPLQVETRAIVVGDVRMGPPRAMDLAITENSST